MSDPGQIDFLSRRLGLRVRPECVARIAGAPWPYQIVELDFRHGEFGGWVASFLDAVEGVNPAAGPAVTVEDLRAALAALDYPGRLADTSLARRLGRSGPEVRDLLRDLLTTGAPPGPLTQAHQEVLRAAFMDGPEGPDTVAAQLHLSRRTYYRRLHDALEALAAALAVSLPPLAPTPPAPGYPGECH